MKDDIRTNWKKNGRQKGRIESQEKLMAIKKVSKEKVEAMRDACLGKMKACLDSKEPTPMEMSIAVHEEVPKEEAAVETFGALKQQYGDWHLLVGCR
jgi:hypothetical protein